jgi:hypothetical protein
VDAGAGGMTGTHPVAYFLKELSGDPARRGGRSLGLGMDGASDLDVQIAEAHARGVLEARAAALMDQDAALAKQQAAFDQKLSAERLRWTTEEGTKIASALSDTLADVERRIADSVNQILKPLILERVREKAMHELRNALAGMLAQGTFAKITVSGPQDLVSQIETEFSGRHDGLTFVPAAVADVTVRADDAMIETRIKAWADAIEGDSR